MCMSWSAQGWMRRRDLAFRLVFCGFTVTFRPKRVTWGHAAVNSNEHDICRGAVQGGGV